MTMFNRYAPHWLINYYNAFNLAEFKKRVRAFLDSYFIVRILTNLLIIALRLIYRPLYHAVRFLRAVLFSKLTLLIIVVYLWQYGVLYVRALNLPALFPSLAFIPAHLQHFLNSLTLANFEKWVTPILWFLHTLVGLAYLLVSHTVDFFSNYFNPTQPPKFCPYPMYDFYTLRDFTVAKVLKKSGMGKLVVKIYNHTIIPMSLLLITVFEASQDLWSIASSLDLGDVRLVLEKLCFDTNTYRYPEVEKTSTPITVNAIIEIFRYIWDNLFSLLWPNDVSGIFMFSAIFFTLCVLTSFIYINGLGLYGVFMLTTVSLGFFWLVTIFAALYYWENNASYTVCYGKWFTLNNSLEVGWDFNFDTTSFAFALLVLTIAFFINVYTFAYFRYEPNVTRLILFIDIFVISMVLLVTAGNFILLYFGWELIGITSFFLINFWATRVSTVKAGFKAFVYNKISDCGMLLAIVLIYEMSHNLNINAFNDSVSTSAQVGIKTLAADLPYIHSVTYCFLLAAFIKSAQFGFHAWLPDSMEAPVPASALIHSATLVSAGIFLVLRLYPLFEFSPFAKTYILAFGAMTAFFGGVCSIFQTDVKRLLAYSTISHCGVLMFLTFFKNPDLVIIYLYVHGFFKAIIFMCMGHVIRFANNYQDMRRMGGFFKYLPFEALISLVALLNLAGVSFTWGYYMKHFLFIETTPDCHFNLFCYALVVLGSLCGLIYSYKLYYYVFFDFKKARKHVYFKTNNNDLKNVYFTHGSLASNIAISLLVFFAYIFCSYLIYRYSCAQNVYFDVSYFASTNNSLKSWGSAYLFNFYFYLNWFIVLIITALISNNWKNNVNPAFGLKFFTTCWVFLFFFYLFYSILIM